MGFETVDVTVVMTYGDDEEFVGTACCRVADHLRLHGQRFELFAIDQGSRDNSACVLNLLREEVPELALFGAPPGRGLAEGAERARGRVIWVLQPGAAMDSLAAFQRALHLTLYGGRDAVWLSPGFALFRRTSCLPLFDGATPENLARGLRRARRRGLVIEGHVPAAPFAFGRFLRTLPARTRQAS